MEFKFEKNLRIMNDLLAYCHNRGADTYHVDIALSTELSVCRIEARLERYPEAAVSQLLELLQTPRQHEVEDSFWGLSGDLDTDPELELIGMMVDEADVSYANGRLVIETRRLEST